MLNPTSSLRIAAYFHHLYPRVCLHVRECKSVCTPVCSHARAEVSGCRACVWGVNALAPSRHLRGARVEWQHVCVSKGVNWAVMVQAGGYDWMKRWDLVRFSTKHLEALSSKLQLNSCPAPFFISPPSLSFVFVDLQAFISAFEMQCSLFLNRTHARTHKLFLCLCPSNSYVSFLSSSLHLGCNLPQNTCVYGPVCHHI